MCRTVGVSLLKKYLLWIAPVYQGIALYLCLTKLISNVGKVSKNIVLDNAVLKGLTEAELKIAQDKNYTIVRLGE